MNDKQKRRLKNVAIIGATGTAAAVAAPALVANAALFTGLAWIMGGNSPGTIRRGYDSSTAYGRECIKRREEHKKFWDPANWF